MHKLIEQNKSNDGHGIKNCKQISTTEDECVQGTDYRQCNEEKKDEEEKSIWNYQTQR